MRNFLLAALALFSLVALVSAQAQDPSCPRTPGAPAEVVDYYPHWAHTTGGEEITVVGCGFTTFSEVVCLWNDMWPGKTSVILDDNTIICETPAGLTHGDFEALPLYTQFDLLFDGQDNDPMGTHFSIDAMFGPFRFGPAWFSFSPTNGVIGGGTPLSITGEGFSEFTSVQVFFDNETVTASVAGDNTLNLATPPGDFNQNAMLDIYFEDVWQFHLHANYTYHYGPVPTAIYPTCGGWSAGGNLVTIAGLNFNDQLIAGTPYVELDFGNNNNLAEFRPATQASLGSGQITFIAPSNNNSWNQVATIRVFFQGRDDQYISYGPYNYGPVAFYTTPTVGYYGGGDTVSIFGCGFTNYTTANITSVTITPPGQPCNNPQIGASVGGLDVITCQSPALSTSSCPINATVSITLATWGNVIGPATLSTRFLYGPWAATSGIYAINVNPTRGPVDPAGNSAITLTGINFFYQQGNNAFSPTCSIGGSGAQANITSNTVFICGNPIPTGDFNTDVNVLYNFNSFCSYLGRYHYGPLCYDVTPSAGFVGGNQQVVLSGEGFNEENYFLLPEFCVDRIVGNTCPQGSGSFIYDTTQIATTNNFDFDSYTVTTPTILTLHNRFFGDWTSVYLYPNNTVFNSGNPLLYCGQYRYGPIVYDVNPKKAPIGPYYTDIATVNTGSVTVSGILFNDPLVTNNIVVAFGNIASQFPVGSVTANSINANTLWGGISNTFHDLTVIFDTCNTSVVLDSLVEDYSVHWGPVISSVFPVWGIKPWDGFTNNIVGSTITVTGAGFLEFYDSGSSTTYARCLVDGLKAYNTSIVDDNTIVCMTPANDFNTNATVFVEFGRTCLGEIPDYSRAIQTPNNIYYRPVITMITPTFGWTSGGTLVTIYGQGFAGWNPGVFGNGDYACFFDHYQSPRPPTVIGDTEVQCFTPGGDIWSARGMFNDDVIVHVSLNGTAGSATDFNDDWKVWYNSFHYGPLCNNLSPSWSTLGGNIQVSTNNLGFDDDLTFYNISFYWGAESNQNYLGMITTTNNPTITFPSNIPKGTCGQVVNPTIVFYDYNDQRLGAITCPDFLYGPYVTDQQSYYLDYWGWDNSEITLTGVDFFDAETTATFGNQSNYISVWFHTSGQTYNQGTRVNVNAGQSNDNTLVLNAPTGIGWGNERNISVQFGPFNQTCVALNVGWFHWGAEIFSINPTDGYQSPNPNTVTVNGVAFTCCGLDQTKTFGIWDSVTQNNLTSSGDYVVTGVWAPPTSTVNKQSRVGLSLNNTYQLNSARGGATLTFYYGPQVWAINPTFGPIRGGTDGPVSVIGKYLDDPFFNQTIATCSFKPTAGAVSPSYLSPVGGVGGIHFGNVDCQTPSYARQCGNFDYVGLRYYTFSGQSYDFPSTDLFQYEYGAYITAVTSTTGDLRSWTLGGLSVTMWGNWIDWYDNSGQVGGRNDHKKALCQFGQFFAYDQSPIQNNPGGSPNSYFVVCPTPWGPFDWTVPVQVILDPKLDWWTTLNSSWHWIPYIDAISRDYSSEEEMYTIVVMGDGFYQYDNVVCNLGGVQGMQSDITDDDKVTCQVQPLNHNVYGVSLTFCDRVNPDGDNDTAQCACNYLGTPDTVVSSFTYTSVGFASGSSYSSGPLAGNTEVTITGIGFDKYTNPTVTLHGTGTLTPTLTNGTNANQIVFLTPAVTEEQVTSITVTFTRTEAAVTYDRVITLTVPAYFMYDEPEPLSVTPNQDFDIDGTYTLTISGEYFNGGLSYWCMFDNFTDQFVVPATSTGVPDWNIICDTPSAISVTGMYVVRVAIGSDANQPGNDQFSASNDVYITYTQRPVITGLEPTVGTEYGGTVVTVRGTGFNGFLSAGQVYCRFNGSSVGGNPTVSSGSTSTSTSGTTTAATVSSSTTTGDAGATTTGGSTGSASTTTGGSSSTTGRRSFLSSEVFGFAARGNNDQIVCRTPLSGASPQDGNATALVQVSIDGGLNWFGGSSPVYFTYLEGGQAGQQEPPSSSASTISLAILALISALATLLF